MDSLAERINKEKAASVISGNQESRSLGTHDRKCHEAAHIILIMIIITKKFFHLV